MLPDSARCSPCDGLSKPAPDALCDEDCWVSWLPSVAFAEGTNHKAHSSAPAAAAVSSGRRAAVT